MNNSISEVVIGALVLTASAVFLWFVVQSTGLAATSSGAYDVTARFRSAEGVLIGSDVRLAGVKIGTVTDLSLDAETYLAAATLTIKDGVQIPDDTEANVASEGLLGGAFIELVPGGSDFMLVSGDEIVNTQSAVSLLNLLVRFATGNAAE